MTHIADQILLIGPGFAKSDFKAHLVANLPHTLAKAVIGLESFQSSEHKSEKQMLAHAKPFFSVDELIDGAV